MSGREIVTLQLGHYANFTGTHWWNLQEASFVYDPKILQTYPKEVNHDVLFREGLTLKGEVTFTPRLVSLDLNGSLKTLRKDGALYSTSKEEDEVKWSGDVTLHKTAPEYKNPFLKSFEDSDVVEETKEGSGDQCSIGDEDDDRQPGKLQDDVEMSVFGKKCLDLDSCVTVWSDFLGVHLHPRSVQLLQDFILQNDDQPFDVFGLGQTALCGDTWDEFEERVRFFTEECDIMQGFHLLFDGHNSFCGSAAKVLRFLKDEYSGKSIMSLPTTPAVVPDQTPRQRSTRILNNALCIGACYEDSSLYIPLSLAASLWRNLGAPREFPHLCYNPEMMYHTSAILAASLDTMTMPYRLESASARLCDLTTSIALMGRKVAALNCAFPFPMLEQETFADTLMSEREERLWQPLTPQADCHTPVVAQSCVLRGIPSNRVKRSGVSSPRQLSGCSTVEDVFQLYLTETYSQALSAATVMRDPVKVVSPFPHIFHSNISQSGFLSATSRHPKCGVDFVPIMTSLQTNASMGNFLSSLHAETSRFNIRCHHHFLEAGLEEEEFTETLHSLLSLSECYSTASDVV